jgi:hypothetical protein
LLIVVLALRSGEVLGEVDASEDRFLAEEEEKRSLSIIVSKCQSFFCKLSMNLQANISSRKERMAALASLKRKAVDNDDDSGEQVAEEIVKFRNYTPSDAPETDALEKTTDLISKA